MALNLGKAVMLMQRPKLAEPGCGSELSISVGPSSCTVNTAGPPVPQGGPGQDRPGHGESQARESRWLEPRGPYHGRRMMLGSSGQQCGLRNVLPDHDGTCIATNWTSSIELFHMWKR